MFEAAEPIGSGQTRFGGVPNLPVMIYQFALSPYPNWQQLAWAGALLITVTILALSVIARTVIKPQRAR